MALSRPAAPRARTSIQPEVKLPGAGSFFPPTLACGVEPADTLAREEVFGPVLAAMTFRTPDEAVALANNTRYGLAASVWTENINRAYEVAARLKAGVVWINATNLFDAGAAFGGYRESGFGREGGREGMAEYLVLADLPRKPSAEAPAAALSAAPGPDAGDGGNRSHAENVYRRQAGAAGRRRSLRGSVVRTGTRSATRGSATARTSATPSRLRARRPAGPAPRRTTARRCSTTSPRTSRPARRSSRRRLHAMTGADGREEVEASIRRLFFYAGFADKYDGAAHATRAKFVTLAMNEPFGVMGIVCPDEAPLLALVSLVAPAIAMGNAVVVVPSARHPLAATDFYSVLDTSDLPGGVVNIVTGEADVLSQTLAEHDGVDALWRAGGGEGDKAAEDASAGNLKSTWMLGAGVDWAAAEGREFLRRACQVKTIWTPYGE